MYLSNRIGDVSIFEGTVEEAAEALLSAASKGAGGLVLTPNISIARELDGDPELARSLQPRWLLLDGVPLGWLIRLSTGKRINRIAGSDLLPAVLTRSSSLNVPVAVLGTGSVELLRHSSSDGSWRHMQGGDLPYAHARSQELVEAAIELIPEQSAVVFVGLGFPKQEVLALKLLQLRPDCVFVGSGAAASLLAGLRPRAPRLWQVVGIEWLWRLLLEPKRMASRYILRDGPWFAKALVIALVKRISARRRRPSF